MKTERSRGVLLAGIAASVLACESAPYEERTVASTAKAAVEARTTRAETGPRLRISVAAMLSAAEAYPAYSDLVLALGRRLATEVEFVQRRSYREVNELIVEGELDVGLLCTGGFLELQRRAPKAVELLAVPMKGGRTTYRSLTIVPASSAATDLEQLEGSRFAFTDPLSLTGRVYPFQQLRARGKDPSKHFGSELFTGSHDRSIHAVANRIVDGASVDSLIYDHLLKHEPQLGEQIRVIHRSASFGMPPFVASTRLEADVRARIRAALLALHEDPAAAAALRRIGLDGFVLPEPGLYETAARVVEEGL